MVSNSDQIITGKFKIVYWWTLWLLFTILLYSRRNQLFTSQINEIDIAVFAVWIIIMLLPLVSEVSVFGVSLKKEIKEFKDDVKSEIKDLKISIQNVALNARMTQNVYQAYPNTSPEQILDRFENNIRDIIRSEYQNLHLDTMNLDLQNLGDVQTEQELIYLFRIRYNLEKAIRRIALNYLSEESVKNRPITFILNNLRRTNIIDPRMIISIREVYAIASKAIHGEQITEKQIAFVRDVSQNLLNYLSSIG